MAGLDTLYLGTLHNFLRRLRHSSLYDFAIPLCSDVASPETSKIYEYTLVSSMVFAGRGYRCDMQRYLHEAFTGVLILAYSMSTARLDLHGNGQSHNEK